MVIATENPYGSSGTQMLPESQLDRFLICLSMGYPSHKDTVAILKDNHLHMTEQVQPVLTPDELLACRRQAEAVYVHEELYEYIVNLSEETRQSEWFAMGVSPRGAIALLRMSKAMAVLDGRDYVTAEDVQKVIFDVFGHRVKISAKARTEGMCTQDAIKQLLKSVKLPRN